MTAHLDLFSLSFDYFSFLIDDSENRFGPFIINHKLFQGESIDTSFQDTDFTYDHLSQVLLIGALFSVCVWVPSYFYFAIELLILHKKKNVYKSLITYCFFS